MSKKINAILIPAIIILLAIASLCVPAKDFSERENRYLASFPEFTWRNIKSGDFTEGTADYLSDHFPARDTWIEINTRRSLLQGKTLINGVFFADDGYLIEKYNRSESMGKIAKVVNNFADKVDADVTFMAAPTSCFVNINRHPLGIDSNAQMLDMNELYDGLSCSKIDLANILFIENQSEPMFYKLDHHWTSRGALAAACAYKYAIEEDEFPEDMDWLDWAEALADYIDKQEDNYRFMEVSDSFRGTLFNKVGECGLEPDIIEAPDLSDLDITYETEEGSFDTIYDQSRLATADQYAYFLSGNHPIATITNGSCENSRTLLIIKDSYANSMVPFLVKDYSKITIIDPRYYGESVSELVNENDIDEVLFVYNMNTLGTDSGIRRVQ